MDTTWWEPTVNTKITNSKCWSAVASPCSSSWAKLLRRTFPGYIRINVFYTTLFSLSPFCPGNEIGLSKPACILLVAFCAVSKISSICFNSTAIAPGSLRSANLVDSMGESLVGADSSLKWKLVEAHE